MRNWTLTSPLKTCFDLRSQCHCHLVTCDLDLEIQKICMREKKANMINHWGKRPLIGSLRNDDADGNDDATKQ